jgi:hypothetical protein
MPSYGGIFSDCSHPRQSVKSADPRYCPPFPPSNTQKSSIKPAKSTRILTPFPRFQTYTHKYGNGPSWKTLRPISIFKMD